MDRPKKTVKETVAEQAQSISELQAEVSKLQTEVCALQLSLKRAINDLLPKVEALLVASSPSKDAAKDQEECVWPEEDPAPEKEMEVGVEAGAAAAGDVVEAARAGDCVALERFLLGGKAVATGRDARGETPLHAAAWAGRRRALDLLLRAGADPDARGPPRRCTPLHVAAAAGHPSVAGALIAAGADAQALDADGLSPLLVAAMFGRGEVVSLLLRLRSPPTRDVRRALARAGNGAVVWAMEDHAPGLLEGDFAVWALLNAAAFGRLATVVALLDAGVAVDAVDPLEGYTALILACKNGHAECARELLVRGASADARTKGGDAALHLAAAGGHAAVAATLAAAGADAGVRNAKGLTAADVAATDEVRQAITSRGQPSSTPCIASPTSIATPTPIPNPIATPTPKSTPTPTPTPKSTITPTPTPIATPTPMVPPTPIATPTPTATPTSIATPNPIATPTPVAITPGGYWPFVQLQGMPLAFTYPVSPQGSNKDPL